MQTRLIRLRFRRRFRKGQQQVEGFGVQAEEQIEKHLLGRYERLLPVRRFMIGWLGLLLLLIGGVVAQNLALSSYYQTLKTIPGGIYTEGVIGRFTNANPLYATSEADTTISRLIFAGLMTYDQHGKLTSDLASGYTVDSRGTTYTVHLRPDVKWQDGRPLTSADVVFTYQLIKNPDTQSPLQSSWQGITVSAPDARTVVFKLPGVLASFPDNLTNGIVPKHLLSAIPPADLRSADFNTIHPVGAGPFAWQAVQVTNGADPQTAQEQVELTPFAAYTHGQPKLQKFVVKAYASKTQLIQAFSDNQLTAVEGLDEVPPNLRNNTAVIEHSLSLQAATMVFFKTSSGVLADQTVRQALVQAADVPNIIRQLGYPTRAVREPILEGQLGYDLSSAQAGYNLKAAKASLDAAGWTVDRHGLRRKAGMPLAFTLSAANIHDYQVVTGLLQQQWRQLGANVTIQLLDPTDFQNALTYHSYDALLNGITIGADPDVFVYWDSSQADIRSTNRLNFSEYKNPVADLALEAGRTRLDPNLRAIKYKPFLAAWQHDAPALGLYQPRLLYLTHGLVNGLNDGPLNTAIDRFDNVQNWEIREAKFTD